MVIEWTIRGNRNTVHIGDAMAANMRRIVKDLKYFAAIDKVEDIGHERHSAKMIVDHFRSEVNE